MNSTKKKQRLQDKILNTFEPMERLSWDRVYLRLKLPVSRNNWDYVEAWQDLKAMGKLQECIDRTYKIVN